MIFKDQNFFVETPKGMKPHGFLKDRKFCRRVTAKDRMKIFDAWSIHPDVLKYLEDNDIPDIHYKDEEKDYRITTESARTNGFERNFSGGKTFYIPIKHWDVSDKGQLKLI